MPGFTLTTTLQTAGAVILSATGIFVWTLLLTRLVGLRTFSKMSSFDFAITVATGSIIATISVTTASLANGAIGLATLLAIQFLIARLRRHVAFGRVVDNQPLLLVREGEFLVENMDHARVTRHDVIAKLRENGCLHLAQAKAVVLETTGDISVLQGQGTLQEEMLEGVRLGVG